MIVSCIVLFIVISGLPTLGSVFNTEKSANRMLMWNVTTQAILNKPVTGTGLGGFPVSFAQTQADYLASTKASDTERMAATCPPFAFNDYLQIGLEFGIAGLLLFALWIAFCLYYGLKNKQVGATGGILFVTFLLHVFLSAATTVILGSAYFLLCNVCHPGGKTTETVCEKFSLHRDIRCLSRLYPVFRTTKLLRTVQRMEDFADPGRKGGTEGCRTRIYELVPAPLPPDRIPAGRRPVPATIRTVFECHHLESSGHPVKC